MPSDFDQLIVDIEREADEEGPQAVRELERFREEFGLAGARIGIAGDIVPCRATGAARREPSRPSTSAK